MIYGTVRFRLFGDPAVAELTEDGWVLRGPADADPRLASILDTLADPREFGPADGDPMVRAVLRLAEILHGDYELPALPSPPPGTIY